MPATELTGLDLESLAQVDGGSLSAAYRNQLRMMARDCIDRPKLKKRRKLTLHVFVETLTDANGEVRGVAVEAELVPVRLPNYVTFPQTARVDMNGFKFDPSSNDGATAGD